MNRRNFLRLTFLGSVTPWAGALADQTSGGRRLSVRPFEWEEATIAEVQAAMRAGTVSSVSLARDFLRRINRIDRRGPSLNSVIEVNPDAPDIARAMDRERRRHVLRGPLQGVPVLVKDNVDTHDRMMTTAGSLALIGPWEPGCGRKFVAGGGGGLSEHHRPGGICLRIAGWDFILWTGLERTGVVEDCVCFRTMHARPETAGVFRNGALV